MAFLDKDGLEHLWSKITAKLASKSDTGHRHDNATTSADGFMSAGDKSKLNGIASGAQVNTITGVKGNSESTYRTGDVNITAANVGADAVGTAQTKADAALASAKTYAEGLNTAMDTRMDSVESKLSGIADGANKTVVDSTLSSTSTNPVQNKVVNSALSGKVPTTRTVNGKALSANISLTASDVGADASGSASSALDSAKTYADEAATKVKNDLLNGAGAAYDTLKELGALIDTNKDAIDALEDVAAGKANASHTHGNITNAGAIGTAANKAVITTTNGVLTTGTVPVASGGTGSTTAAGALTNLGLTATASEINVLDGITATTAELNYVDGVTSSIQSQLDSKAAATTVSNHIGDSTHISSTERTNWNAAKTHADSAHAPSNAEKNQNAFSNVIVGSTTVSADSATDSLTLIAGTNVTLTPNTTNDSVTITAKDTVYEHPSYTAHSNGLYKVTVDDKGHVSGVVSVAKSDITALGIPAQDTTYSAATTSAAGLMSSGDKSKLNGIASGAEVNQNAFSNVVVGDVTVAADSKTDTLTLVAGSNVTLTGDATNDKVTIAAKDTTYSAATQSTAGLMSASDKKKLDGIASGAEVNQSAFSNVVVGSTTIAADGKTDSLTLAGSNVTLTPDATNDKVTIGITKTNVTTALGYTPPTQDTTYSAATQSAAGLMSAADKTKLDGIATGANNYTYNLPAATSSDLGGVKIGSNISNSSGTISLTKANVTAALGYTPPTQDTTYTLSSFGITATASELNYVDGVTSNIQTQLNAKASSSSLTSHTGNTSNPHGVTASQVGAYTKAEIDSALSGKAASSHTHTGLQAVTTSGTGAAYTATVSGITSLTKGVNFIMIPHTQSTTKTPTLNVNGLGAKTIQRYISANDYSTEGYNESWLQSTRPVLVIYSGTYWYVQAMDKPAAYDLRGTVPIASGGTGATDAVTALANLGITMGTSAAPSTGTPNSIYIQLL